MEPNNALLLQPVSHPTKLGSVSAQVNPLAHAKWPAVRLQTQLKRFYARKPVSLGQLLKSSLIHEDIKYISKSKWGFYWTHTCKALLV